MKRLEEREYRVVRGTETELAGYDRRLTLPSGFSQSVLGGRQVTLTLTRQGGGLGADYDELRVGRAVYTVLADLVVTAKDGAATPQGLAAIAEQISREHGHKPWIALTYDGFADKVNPERVADLAEQVRRRET